MIYTKDTTSRPPKVIYRFGDAGAVLFDPEAPVGERVMLIYPTSLVVETEAWIESTLGE